MSTVTESRSPLKRLFTQPAFIAAVAVLGIAAVGLNAATQAMKVYFKKEAVPLRHKLDSPTEGIPSTLGPWVMVKEELSLDPDTQHALGTEQFAFRTYVNRDMLQDAKNIKPEDLVKFDGADETTQGRLLAMIQAEMPEAIVHFQMTYYTGLLDTVTHIPDRCMIAGGYQPTSYDVKDWTFTLPDGSTRDLKFRFINFEDQTGAGKVPTRIAYFFHSNGAYSDDHAEVRLWLQNLFERHGYYSKIELMTHGRASEAADTEASLQSVTDLLTHALPEIERCLPDWKQVKAKK